MKNYTADYDNDISIIISVGSLNWYIVISVTVFNIVKNYTADYDNNISIIISVGSLNWYIFISVTVFNIVKNYTADYDKTLIFNKIHHELNQVRFQLLLIWCLFARGLPI